MYSRHEISQLRQAFWTAFGQYMSLHLSSEGEKINWLNYKTGEKNVAFKMSADKISAIISIDITHSDETQRQRYYEQFLRLRNQFEEVVGEKWQFEKSFHTEDGKLISRIYKELTMVNVFNKEDWPTIISFLKPRLIALDAFWNDVKYAFEILR
jgi:hypothetical protein